MSSMHKNYIPDQDSWIFKDMDQILWKNLVLFYSICAFFLFVLEKSSGADLQYEACKPSHCGNGSIIKFPFYIKGFQPRVCGYPGFEVKCSSDGYPRIYIPENDYVIEQINYQSHSFRVYNAAVLDIRNNCLSQIENVTLPSIQFSYVESDSLLSLHLFRKCYFYHFALLTNDTLVEVYDDEFSNYTVDCSDKGIMKSEQLAVIPNYYLLNKILEDGRCHMHVVAPVEPPKRIAGFNVSQDYKNLLRRGFVLNWSAIDCSACERSGGRCGYNISTYSLMCFCPGGPHVSVCESKGPREMTVALVLGISAAIVLVLLVSLLSFKRKYLIRFWINISKKNQNVEALLKSYGLLAPKRCSYSAVKKMTNGFKDKLGQGGFGSVYKGKLHDGTLVAVKILNESKSNGEDFINEVVSVGRTSHVNIVALLGFCFDGSKRAVIYEFMPNGSLETFIYNSCLQKNRLGWRTLFQIAVGVARGLEYLHQGCNTRILHFDIKPHNILLDKDFCPKISDFGLAKLCPDRASKVSMLGTRGTAGYIAPEIFIRKFGQVSHKSDVYSYGMMVLEMIGGRRNIDVEVDRTSEIYFPHWIHSRLQLNDNEIGLQDISNEDEKKFVKKMIIVGLWCIQIDPTQRPSISEVLGMLEGSLESLQIPPKPSLISPPVSLVNSSITG